MNEKTVVIKRVIFSEIPVISKRNDNEDEEGEYFKPYLQVFKEAKILYNSLSDQKIPKYKSTDLSLWFDLNIDVIIINKLFACI